MNIFPITFPLLFNTNVSKHNTEILLTSAHTLSVIFIGRIEFLIQRFMRT